MSDSSDALDHTRKKAEQVGLEPRASGSEGDQAIDLVSVWNTITRSKWLILAICVLITAAAAGYTWTLPQVYEATSIVSIDRNEEGPPMSAQAGMPMGEAPEVVENEIGVLENSGELSSRVVNTMRAISDTTHDVQFTLFEPEEEDAPVDDHTAVQRLQEMVEFEGDAEQGLIEIVAQSESAEESALIANVYAEEYRSFSQEMARAGVTAAREFLEGQLEKRKEDIQQLENEWEAFARNNDVATEGPDGQGAAQKYMELQTRRDELGFRLEQEQRRLTMMEEQLEQARSNMQASVKGEQKAQSLRTQIQALEDKIAELKTQAEEYYINNPELRGNEDQVPELAEITRRIEGFEERKSELTEELVALTGSTTTATGDGTVSINRIENLRDRIREQEQTVAEIEAQINAVENQIEQYEQRIDDIPSQQVQREQLDRRLQQAEQFYKNVANELQKTIIAEESELGYVKIMRTAVVPAVPVSPNFEQNILLGLLLGLGLGLGFAFVRQSMNWQIYEPNDIQEEGYSLVGVIPAMENEIEKSFKGEQRIEVEGNQLSTNLLPLLNPWSPITENYRLVRANLKFAGMKNGGGKEPPEVMMVTSPEPEDGKTTTATNLATTMALSGSKILLVDADLRRPNAHQMLGSEKSPGLAEMLANGVQKDILQSTMIDDLFFLPAGTPSVPPTEMLDSDQMSKLLEWSREQFDAVIIDTPPVLAATDPIVLAPHCDGVLVVASADKTDFRALNQVEDTLGAVGVPISGVIFNRYEPEKSGGSYSYGYGYEYEYSYAPET